MSERKQQGIFFMPYGNGIIKRGCLKIIKGQIKTIYINIMISDLINSLFKFNLIALSPKTSFIHF